MPLNLFGEGAEHAFYDIFCDFWAFGKLELRHFWHPFFRPPNAGGAFFGFYVSALIISGQGENRGEPRMLVRGTPKMTNSSKSSQNGILNSGKPKWALW